MYCFYFLEIALWEEEELAWNYATPDTDGLCIFHSVISATAPLYMSTTVLEGEGGEIRLNIR
jgi:hypothetical protein